MGSKNYVKLLAKKIICLPRGTGFAGEDVYISPSSELSSPKKIFLKNRAVLEKHSRLCANGQGAEIRIGEGTTIYPYALLKTNGGKIIVGDFCSINDYAIIYGNGGVSIGDRARISAHAVIVASEHVYEKLGYPDFGQTVEAKGIKIEPCVWIGANAVILDGVTIGTCSVIGAGAVVTKDIPPYSVAVGVPAKVIKRWK